MHNNAKNMALCGVFAAVAVVIMAMGTLIPLATFVCPMLCMMALAFVLRVTNQKMAWAWYISVAVLSLLFAPDREAAVCFVFLGYYPIIKPKIDKSRLRILLKLLLFNAGIAAMYATLIYAFGMDALLQEFVEMGKIIGLITLLLGNLCLFCFDYLLNKFSKLY